MGSVFLSKLSDLFSWAKAGSLWFVSTGQGCCANELFQVQGSRYDLERFGCREVDDPAQADVLFVNGLITAQAEPYVRSLYDQMQHPKYVIALGACACRGGSFAESKLGRGAAEVLPVDVFVPGCPPRPEAIMDGVIALQEKIREQRAGNSGSHPVASH